MSLLSIPDDFGQGGANIGDGSPKLREILQNHAEEISARALDSALSGLFLTFIVPLLNGRGLYEAAAFPSFAPSVDVTITMPPDVGGAVFYIPIDSTGTHNITLSAVGAVNGNRIRLIRPGQFDSGVLYHVINGGTAAGTLFSVPAQTGEGESVDFSFNGTDWILGSSGGWGG